MDLEFYNQEVDKILWDIIGSDSFLEDDLPILIDTITNTIYMYHKNITKENLWIIINHLMEQKYQKRYTYNNNSEYNKVDDFADKISINNCKDLVSHRYDVSNFEKEIHITRYNRVLKIKDIPQHEQKSKEWLDQRNRCITATAIAIVLDEDPYKHPAELLLDKCGKGIPFEDNENTHHGKKYELIGNMYYCFRNNVQVGEYGLIQHEDYPFIGASPDGICDKYTLNGTALSKLVGRLLEIKFPRTRNINVEGSLDGDICPHQYYIQCLTQLFVTELDECDFLQCKMEEYKSWNEFVNDTDPIIPGLSKTTKLEKGCLIQLLPKKQLLEHNSLFKAQYIYPPKLHLSPQEIEKWIASEVLKFPQNQLANNYVIDKVIYWRFMKITCNLIKADHEWFESKVPTLKQFWLYVKFYRKHPDILNSLVEFINETGFRNSDKIFKKVHDDYLSVKKKSKYKPLYQTKNPWRIQLNEKYKYKK